MINEYEIIRYYMRTGKNIRTISSYFNVSPNIVGIIIKRYKDKNGIP